MSAVRISLVVTAPAEITVDALAVPVATGQRLAGSALDLDRALGGLLSELLANAEFKGRRFDTTGQGAAGSRNA